MKKMFINQLGKDNAQSLHREQLPMKFCQTEGLEITYSNILEHLEYDIFLFQRLVSPRMVPIIENLKQFNKTIIWSLDDSLWDIVPTNPCYPAYDEEGITRCNWLAQIADRIIVSTDGLKEIVKENTGKDSVVLPNLLDITMWPVLTEKEQHVPKVLWAGSIHHDDDLLPITKIVNKVIEKLKPNIQFIFYGDWPQALAKWCQSANKHYLQQVPISKYVGFVYPTTLKDYPHTLISLDAQIGLIPLADNKFNKAKSNLKELEYQAANIYPTYDISVDNIISLVKNTPLVDRHKLCLDWSWQSSDKVNLWKKFFKSLL